MKVKPYKLKKYLTRKVILLVVGIQNPIQVGESAKCVMT